MLKTNKLCNVCKTIEQNPRLMKAIYNSKSFIKSSSITLLDIHEEYGANGSFSYDALRNHAKKHQFLSEKEYNNRHLRQIARDAEKKVLKRRIETGDVWDKFIQEGMEKLESGDMLIKASDLLKATKDKSDYELKTKDQQLAYAEMMYYFASGEGDKTLRKTYEHARVRHASVVEGETVEHQDITAEAPADSPGRTDGPGGVHYPPTWDAPTFGTGEVPAGDDF